MDPTIAVVQANGSVRALFVENARISAGGDIVVQELAMKSDLRAGNRITVGEPGSRKGHIIGGICRAGTEIDAIVAGSRAGVSTRMEVGADPAVQEKLASVMHTLRYREKDLEESSKSLAYVRENPSRIKPEVLKLKEKFFLQGQIEIRELTRQRERLQKRMLRVENAKIKVEREAYSGVLIRIGEKMLVLDEDMENVTFSLGEDGIAM